MRYVLAHNCDHEDHDDEAQGHIAYLHEENPDFGNKIVKVFECKQDAVDFMKDNRWSPKHVMVVPYEECTFDE